MLKRRVHVYYSGRVHGVGFRMTAEETARQLGVVGWVRNLRDGRVELVAEDHEVVLTRFLEAIRTGPMGNFIRDVEVRWSGWTGSFSEFTVRYFE